jgi:hypothetical protein
MRLRIRLPEQLKDHTSEELVFPDRRWHPLFLACNKRALL